jgi:hypothetical protein
MKKVVRMLGLCALVALAFTSCKKNDNTNKVTFKATITQPVADERTIINSGNSVVWVEGDEIQVFDENGNTTDEPFVATLTGDERVATFTGDATFLANINEADTYTAFYPVQTYNPTEGTVTMNAVPYEQTYVPRSQGRIMTDLFPMTATNDDEGNFVFSSDAGTLRISLFSTDETPFYVKRIEIISNSQEDMVNGTLVYNNVTREKNVVPSAVNVDANKVVLECGDVSLSDDPEASKDFEIVVLGGVFSQGFTMNVVRDNDEVYTVVTNKDNTINGGHVRAMYAIDVINPGI